MCNLKIIKGKTVYVLETSWQGHWKKLRSIDENIKWQLRLLTWNGTLQLRLTNSIQKLLKSFQVEKIKRNYLT